MCQTLFVLFCGGTQWALQNACARLLQQNAGRGTKFIQETSMRSALERGCFKGVRRITHWICALRLKVIRLIIYIGQKRVIRNLVELRTLELQSPMGQQKVSNMYSLRFNCLIWTPDLSRIFPLQKLCIKGMFGPLLDFWTLLPKILSQKEQLQNGFTAWQCNFKHALRKTTWLHLKIDQHCAYIMVQRPAILSRKFPSRYNFTHPTKLWGSPILQYNTPSIL